MANTTIPIELSSTPGIVDNSNATAITIDSSENVGIGVTPAAHGSLFTALDIDNTAITAFNDVIGIWEANTYYDGSEYKYRADGYAGQVLINNAGEFQFKQAASGTAGATATLAQNVTVDSSGNVGIGTTSPQASLHVVNEINVAQSTYRKNGMRCTSSDNLELFADDNNEGTGSFMFFSVDGAERMRIDSSGNVLVGTTSSLLGKHTIQANQSTNGESVLSVYNQSLSDLAPALNVIKNSTTTSSGARFVIFRSDGGTQLMGQIVGNGASNVQFASLSDERLKENIQPLSGSLDKVLALNPISYNWKDSGEHIEAGFVAQEVEQVLPEYVTTEDDADQTKGLTGGMTAGYISVLTKAIQEQQTLIESLEARITALES
jgi:hypothetical protein